jgi:CheY-like chemotaxis protein
LRAASGQEALVTAQALDGDLPLVVTDIRMPGMDGIKMAERLVQQLRRAPRVLFVSGYTPPSSLPGPLLIKPFSPQALLGAVRRMLSDSVPPTHRPLL